MCPRSCPRCKASPSVGLETAHIRHFRYRIGSCGRVAISDSPSTRPSPPLIAPLILPSYTPTPTYPPTLPHPSSLVTSLVLPHPRRVANGHRPNTPRPSFIGRASPPIVHSSSYATRHYPFPRVHHSSIASATPLSLARARTTLSFYSTNHLLC